MLNLKMKIAIWLINKGIGLFPKDWQTIQFIENLVHVKKIKLNKDK
tara:strand:- start:2838 stop:2975 length:138 start_codon:yes stop_codon:yes gene_type:complete